MSLSGGRVLVTGGAGFVGSTLVGNLVERNEIVVFDSFSRDAIGATGLLEHPNVTAVVGDVRDADAVEAAAAGCTHVVHCAAIAGIDTVGKSPVTTMEVNVLGSANALRAAHRARVTGRVVCFSTSEIFGRRAFRANEEDDAVVGPAGEPRWTYAASKLAEEHWALGYHVEHGLPTVVLRPFNVYGPGQVGEGAIRIFVERALAGEPLFVNGDGSQVRAWCYIDDMVRAVLLALEHPGAVGRSFNIGNARSATTIAGLASLVVRLAGSNSAIVHRPATGADIELRVPDTYRAREVLGFEAEVDLEEGLRRTIAAARGVVG